MGRMRFSRWNIVGVAALAALCFTTFQPVIQATIVHPGIGGNIFEIASYVGGLASLYALWLPLMMSQGSGERTAALLGIGQTALYALCVVAVAALVAIVLGLVLNVLGKRKAARAFGLVGFVLALVVPAACVVVVWAVQTEMSSNVISIAVLDVRPVCYWQLAVAAVGLVGTVLATRTIADPKRVGKQV